MAPAQKSNLRNVGKIGCDDDLLNDTLHLLGYKKEAASRTKYIDCDDTNKFRCPEGKSVIGIQRCW